MKIEVNIEKKYFFSIVAVFILVLAAIGVYAVWDNSKTLWHSSNDVKVTINGQDYSLQEAITNGKLGGVPSSISFYSAGPASGTETKNVVLGSHSFCALSSSSIALDNFVNWKSDICNLVRDQASGNWTLYASSTNSYTSCSAVCFDYGAGSTSATTSVSESGTLCGLSIVGDICEVQNLHKCGDTYPSVGCPAGYTQSIHGRIVWDADYYKCGGGSLITGARLKICVKN